jgi:hypothetical protein
VVEAQAAFVVAERTLWERVSTASAAVDEAREAVATAKDAHRQRRLAELLDGDPGVEPPSIAVAENALEQAVEDLDLIRGALKIAQRRVRDPAARDAFDRAHYEVNQAIGAVLSADAAVRKMPRLSVSV